MTSDSTAVVTLDTPELEALPASKAEAIRAVFVPMAERVQLFEDEFREIVSAAKEEVTPELSGRARRLRIDIAKVRIDAEKCRIALKEEFLLGGRAVDGTNNILKWAISQKEAALAEIENHAVLMERQRIEALQEERAEALSPYVEGAHERDLGTMDEDVWAAYLSAKRQEHEDRLEAERKAEAERKERERIEALERERAREAAPYYRFLHEDVRDALGELDEKAYANALAAAKEAHEAHEAEQERIRKEREKLEAEAKAREAEREKERERERKRLAAERKKREALEAAEKERRAKEEAEREAREKAEAEAAKAPVKARLSGWVGSFALPDLPGDDHAVAGRIREKFAGFREWARKEVDGI